MVARNASPEEKREYMRTWKRANVERNRELNRKSARKVREADPERIAEQQRRYYWKTRERRLDDNRGWYARLGANATTRARKRAAQNHTESKANRSRARWSEADDATVMRTDLTRIEAALILGRTLSAVENRRRALRKAVTP